MKTQMKKSLLALVFIISLVSLAKADLARRIDGIIRQPSQKKVQFSIHIIKADSGQTVYTHNAARALIPASNMKIIVTAAALKYLGPNYQYKTKVGLCDNTLTVLGSGDPLLGDKVTDAKYGRQADWIFEDITAALKQNGIKTIRDIIIDTSIFDDQRVHPNWPKEELNRWYACEVSGLNFNGNCVEISAINNGGTVNISIEPDTSFVEVFNKVIPISKGNSVIGSYRSQELNKIVVHGKCKEKAGPFAVAIERPAAFFGFLLAENLAKAGINTNGQLIVKTMGDDCNFRLLTEYSTPIADCLARCNKDSLQLAAEALLKTIAVVPVKQGPINSTPGRKNGSWIKGREIISQYLVELGIKRDQFYIDDGSGLSRHNKLSAYSITKVLSDVYKSKDWTIYKDSLAAGGVDGTISKYFKEEKYKGKVLGKTGYIDKVKSFSGICSTKKGDYIFSILANNTNGQTREAINDIAKAIIDDAYM